MGSSRRPEQVPPVGFDFTGFVRLLCADIVARTEPLAHVDIDRVAIAFCQTRTRTKHGLYASLTPMRFEGGHLTTCRRGRRYAAQRLYDDAGREMLYILRFYLPRFWELAFREKLATVIHELWHISPAFDGDLRRFEGRCYAHSGSQKRFDAQIDQLTDHYLAQSPSIDLLDVLRYSFTELVRCHGRVRGVRIPQPKLIPLS